MRRLTFLALLIALGQYTFAYVSKPKIQIKFQIHPVHYLVSFVEAASGNSSGSKHLRRVYQASDFNTPKNRKILDRFKALALDYESFKYPGFPNAHMTSTSLWDLFKMAASQSSDLADLQQRTAGIYPASIQKILFEVFKEMKPTFEQLFWKPLIKDAQAKLQDLEKYLAKNQVSEKFEQIARFYGSQWNSDLPFVVNLHPLPASYRRGSSAEFRGNILTCDFPLAMRNKAIFLGIVIHELSHILYEQQSVQLQKNIEQWFLDNDLKNRQFAYQWINEALATACGNAWFFRELTDSLETGSWYGNPYIDQFARKMLPEVSRYIQAGKTIDQAFVTNSIRTFAQAFPNALYEYDQWMNNILVLHAMPPQQYRKLEHLLYENFRISRNRTISNAFTTETLKRLKQSTATNVIVVAQNHQKSLRFLQKEMGSLSQFTLNPKESFLLTYLRPNQIPLIVVNLQNKQAWPKAIAQIRKMKKYDPKRALIKLN
ncbi:hypothetical protein BKI52_20020 [marine bacterium AO1-C]|nr:hypothetical protein BKI52_20020 [marine bacterium AO1-C]